MADDCSVLFDFSNAADRAAWRVQNDTVMGGNSEGEMDAAGGALVFEGRLVTAGGGFVQVNADLPEGALQNVREVRVTGRSEGRPWRLRMETDQRVPAREMRGGEEGEAPIGESGPDQDGPRVAFSVPLEGLGTDEAKTATADLSDPEASSRGRPVPGATWAPGKAVNVALILSDGEDAPYRLEITKIEACR